MSRRKRSLCGRTWWKAEGIASCVFNLFRALVDAHHADVVQLGIPVWTIMTPMHDCTTRVKYAEQWAPRGSLQSTCWLPDSKNGKSKDGRSTTRRIFQALRNCTWSEGVQAGFGRLKIWEYWKLFSKLKCSKYQERLLNVRLGRFRPWKLTEGKLQIQHPWKAGMENFLWETWATQLVPGIGTPKTCKDFKCHFQTLKVQ